MLTSEKLLSQNQNSNTEKPLVTEKIENTSNEANEILWLSEIEQKFLKILGLKPKLKENKELVFDLEKVFEEIYKNFSQNPDIFSRQNQKKIQDFKEFIELFKHLYSLKPEQKIEKNKNTKQEIFLIGQAHFSPNTDNDIISLVKKSQKTIHIFFKYFYKENNFIGMEWMNLSYITGNKEILNYNISQYLQEKWFLNHYYQMNEKYRDDFEKFSKNIHSTFFLGKHYDRKNTEENHFKNILIQKYGLHIFEKENPWISYFVGTDKFFLWNDDKIINVEYTNNRDFHVATSKILNALRNFSFLQYIFFKILSNIREHAVLVNIKKYFSNNQEEIPLIFGSAHIESFQKNIEKYNKKHPNEQYSLKVIDVSFIEK